MNTKASYKGFKSTKWDNKTDSQKVKAIKNQYEKLGFKIPKYLQNQKISDKQFLGALNRIEKTYQRRIEKEQPIIKMSDIQYIANKYNKLVDTRLKQFQKQGFTDKAINYLQGKLEFTTLGTRPVFANNSLLEKIELDNMKANKQGRRVLFDIINHNYNNLKSNGYINKVLNTERNKPFLQEFMSFECFDSLDDSEKQHLINMFSNLNIVQQEVAIQSELDELRERYKDSPVLYGDKLDGLYKKISTIIENVEKEI